MRRSDIYVGLGANLGDPVQQIRGAIHTLGQRSQVRVCAASSLYRSTPMGGLDQPDYVNAVVQVETDLEPAQFLQELQGIEREYGREREHERWASRTLDLDLLLWGEECYGESALTIPHPGAHEREFVLVPLHELAPDLDIPGRGAVSQLIAQQPASQICRIASSWCLPKEARLIAVEGPMGVGKTTLCNRLAADFDGLLMLEDYQDNPFLEQFFEQPERTALAAQIHFLISRTNQMQRFAQNQLFQQPVFSDYINEKSDWFSRLSLSGDEYDLWLDLYSQMTGSLPRPDLVIYLQAPVPHLLQRIKMRGRTFEREVKAEFLERLSALMTEYFRNYRGTVLTVDTSGANLSAGQQDYQSLLAVLNRMQTPGQYFLDPSQSGTKFREVPELTLA